MVFWVWTLDRLRAPVTCKPEVYDAIGSLVRRLVLRPIANVNTRDPYLHGLIAVQDRMNGLNTLDLLADVS